VYSSFGHSSLSVPISRWLERVTVRHQIDVLNAVLAVGELNHDIDVRTARTQLHLTDEEIREKLKEDTDYGDIRLQALGFRRIPLAWASQFLSRIQGKYTEMVGEKLPAIRGDIHYRRRQLASKQTDLGENLLDPLEDYVLDLMDEPRSGIIKAHLFLETLRKDLQRDRERLVISQEKKQQDGKNMSRRIDQSRQVYFGRAEVASGFGTVPFVKMFGLILLGVIPLGLLMTSYAMSGAPVVNWVVMVGLLAATVVMMGRMYNTLQTARYRVVKTYDDRLQAFRDADLLGATIQLYDELIHWTGNIRGGVNMIWENLTDIRTSLNGEWDRVADPKLLCGLSPDRMSEYLLTPESIRQWEKRVQSDDYLSLTETLRQEMGTPSEWIRSGSDQDELAARLRAFASKRVSHDLRRFDLREALKRIEEKSLLNKFNRVHQLSYPYWRHDPTKSNLRESPWQVVAVADSDLEIDKLFGTEFQRFDIQNPYELVVASVRHGFSLAEMNNYTQLLAKAYDYTVQREREMLHTTADRLAMPDPADREPEVLLRTVPARQLYAIGRALDVLHVGEVNGLTGLEVSWGDKNGMEVPLGTTSLETVFKLEKDETLQSEVREAVTSVWSGLSSLEMIELWSASIDERQPEFWAKLAAEDFLSEVNEEAMLV
jgi:hypothetical protein